MNENFECLNKMVFFLKKGDGKKKYINKIKRDLKKRKEKENGNIENDFFFFFLAD